MIFSQKYKYFKALFLVQFIVLSFPSIGQVISEENANKLLEQSNYIEAVKMYEELLKKDPTNIQFNINAGLCYLNGHLVHSKALPFFDKAAQADIDDADFLYLHALALQHALRFDPAIKKFEEYKTKPKADIPLADKHIKECQTGKKYVFNRVDISFTNMGENFNSEFADYYPFVSKSNDLLIFTARTSRSTGGFKAEDGYYSSDLWYSEKIENVFQKPKNFGATINSNYDEQCVGLSNDGTSMFIYSDKDKTGGDIYISEKSLKSFKKPEIIEGNVNSTYLETSASLSDDGNTLFFASDRPGGKGGVDLYMTRKLPNGEWGQAQNIVAINTEFNEDFPTLSADGKTLYFCSEGHENMGGYDIFKSEWDPATNDWTKPVNIGYPINTPADEHVISFTDGHHAYISAIRNEGYGDYDIYQITFNEQRPKLLIKVKLEDSEGNTSIKDPDIYVYDQYSEQIAHSRANPKNGEYLIILPEGQFSIEVDSPDHIYHTSELTITSDMVSQGILFKTIKLEK